MLPRFSVFCSTCCETEAKTHSLRGERIPMQYLLNLLYLLTLILLSPWLLYKAFTTGKYRRGLASKLLGSAGLPPASGPRAWFHGVSVGEIHLLRQLVAAFRRQ